MTENNLIYKFNQIYRTAKYPYIAVLEEVEEMLTYGQVIKKEDGLYCVTTAGYSEDEAICHALVHILCRFGYYHYVGYLRGEAFYFSESKHDSVEINRFTPIEERRTDTRYSLEWETDELCQIAEYGNYMSCEEAVDRLNELDKRTYNMEYLLNKQNKILEPIINICKDYNIPITAIAETLEEYIERDNQ